MDKKEEFRKGLARLQKKAESNCNHITVGEILACFPGLELSRDQIRLIYQYAEEEHIVIEDYEPHDTRSVTVGQSKPKLSGEEKEYFQMYLKDLKSIPPCQPEEEAMLAERLLMGDDSVIPRLTEGNLSLILDIAREHTGKGVLIGDLVQEGNMALMLALDEMAHGTEAFLAGGMRDYLSQRADKAMRRLIAEQGGYDRTGQKMARETNRLLAATLELEEELGREATLSELAEKVKLPEDKVKELIRISLNAAEFSMDSESESEEEATPRGESADPGEEWY